MITSNHLSLINSLIFKVVEDEASRTGVRLKSIFGNAFRAVEDDSKRFGFTIKSIFNSVELGIDFNTQFKDELQADTDALKNYKDVFNETKDSHKAYAETMLEASEAAQLFAQNHDITSESITAFEKQQRKAQVATMAGNKTFGDAKKLINEYNSGFKNCNLSHDEFVDSVSSANTSLGKYFKKVGEGKATFKGYIASLVATKASTIALEVASMALNAALTMGLSFAISKVVEGLDWLIHRSERVAEKAAEVAEQSREAADKMLDESASIDELIEKYEELASKEYKDASTREELVEIQKKIVDLVDKQGGKYDDVIEELDLVNGKLGEQLSKLREIQQIKFSTETLPKLEKAYKDSSTATKEADLQDANWAADLLYGDNVITIDYWGNNKERDQAIGIIDKVWERKGYGNAEIGSINSILGEDTYSKLTFDENLNDVERYEAINTAIEALRSADDFDYYNNGLYNELVNISTEYGALIDSQRTAANNLTDSLISNQILGSGSVSSLEEYKILRQSIISNTKSNEGVQNALEDGVITEKSIAAAVDTQLGSVARFSDYYEELAPELYLESIKKLQK